MTTSAALLDANLTPSDRLTVSDHGDLLIEGARAADLVARYGSPLFVFSEATLVANYRRVRAAFAAVWPGPVNAMYAIKCNPNFALRAVLYGEGAGGDCFGLPEIEATFAGGADPALIALNGSHKTEAELRRAMEIGITINMDAEEEIDLVERVATDLDTRVRVNIRLKVVPEAFADFSSDSYPLEGDVRGFLTSLKWGVTLPAAERMVRRLQGHERLELTGYHSHFGRLVRKLEDFASFEGEAGRMIAAIYEATGFAPKVIDIGGGWPRKRDPESRSAELNPHDIEDYARIAVEALRAPLDAAGCPTEWLWVEPGRYIVGNAGVLLTTAGGVKRDADMMWLNVDASGNILPVMVNEGSVNLILPTTGMGREADTAYDVVGPICIPDVLAANYRLPAIEDGEVMAVLDAGFYAEGEAAKINSVPFPASVLVNDGEAELIRRAETWQEVFQTQIIPERLRHAGLGDNWRAAGD